ncbi:MAG: response regulator transcription factor [Endomicrobiia bacterium]|nr:response regulator transcription factor [Endomicrobiia bacterium]
MKESTKKILLFEDDEGITQLIACALGQDPSFELVEYGDSDRPLEKVREHKPDLIILDLNLPSVSGWDVIKIIRQDKSLGRIPVIMITGHYRSASDIVNGLGEFEADDYVLKPFSPNVLLARVKAMLRRRDMSVAGGKKTGESREIKFAGIRINPDNSEVSVNGGNKVELTQTEFNILFFLMKRSGKTCTRDEIYDYIGAPTEDIISRVIDKHIVGIRKKLGKYGSRIKAVFGVGYSMDNNDD